MSVRMEEGSHLSSMSEPPLNVLSEKKVGQWPRANFLQAFPYSNEQDLDALL